MALERKVVDDLITSLATIKKGAQELEKVLIEMGVPVLLAETEENCGERHEK